mmetsp:Transcript_44126/g.134380  ORF Transcript_44126/g.134380 Transcript_44126/m.134380 type:complete len:233 (+) Transcript_44126:422-1120(+)
MEVVGVGLRRLRPRRGPRGREIDRAGGGRPSRLGHVGRRPRRRLVLRQRDEVSTDERPGGGATARQRWRGGRRVDGGVDRRGHIRGAPLHAQRSARRVAPVPLPAPFHVVRQAVPARGRPPRGRRGRSLRPQPERHGHPLGGNTARSHRKRAPRIDPGGVVFLSGRGGGGREEGPSHDGAVAVPRHGPLGRSRPERRRRHARTVGVAASRPPRLPETPRGNIRDDTHRLAVP